MIDVMVILCFVFLTIVMKSISFCFTHFIFDYGLPLIWIFNVLNVHTVYIYSVCNS